jgi:hypothetical protein
MIARKRVTPFECYTDYLALKQHFTRVDYDYVKYKGKVRVNADSFDKRTDKIFFAKIAKHNDAHNFLLSNMVKNPKVWVRDMAYNEEAQRVYEDWIKRIESLTYNFKNELSRLKPDFDSNFKVSEYDHPHLLKLYLRGEVSIETLVILVTMTKCVRHWDKMMKDDPIWQETRLIITKYSTFLKFDEGKIKQIILDKFSQE